MDGLNYHHLFYFWTVAKQGSISKASVELQLTQPTISEQIRLLESALGRKLFDRVGRSLVLTDTGHQVYGYADKIFSLGGELTATLQGKVLQAQPVLRVGITTGTSTALVAKALRPIAKLKDRAQVFIRHSSREVAMAALLADELQIVFATEAKSTAKHLHLIEESSTAFFATSNGQAKSTRFPKSLGHQPFLLPSEPMRSELLRWFRAQKVQPEIAGEIDDPEAAWAMAEAGYGAIAMPYLKGTLTRTLKLLGKTNSIRTRLYAFTKERRPTNPMIATIVKASSSR